MWNKKVFPILLLFMMMLVFSIASVSAQVADIDGMNNEQLTVLLLQILGRLKGEEDKVPEASVLIATIVPLIESEPETELLKHTVYAKKKLVIENLPNSMFVQKKQSETEKMVDPADVIINISEIIGTACSSDGCVWDYGDGILYCSCG